jgi:cytochrome c peroxidase
MKTTHLKAVAASLIAITMLGQSCKTEDSVSLQPTVLDLPETPFSYNIGSNEHIPTLGRVLFYDKQLSANNSVSCGSCHKQALAFADNVAFSKGFANKLTTRNSMPIQNLFTGFVVGNPIFNGSSFIDSNFGSGQFFWDGRDADLAKMVLRPIMNHVEMGISDLNKLSEKLRTIPYYQELFTNAYGSDEVTPEKISDGIRQFILSIQSNNTLMDKARQGGARLTALQSEGEFLFTEIYDCNACHQVQSPHGYIFAGGTFANIGLDPEYNDDGVAQVTGRNSDAGKFKIPSLRNVANTAPYMHDGRFETLDEVVEHYSTGIEDHPNLDPRLAAADGQPLQLNITEHDKRALIAFLGTLTDQGMLTDPKFSNPFKTK